MRIAIITDIHEDYELLEKALGAFRTAGYDMLVCLGIITGFAPGYYTHIPDANACIGLFREYADILLAGNYNLYSSQRLPSYHLEKNIPLNWNERSIEERFCLSNNTLWLYEEEIAPCYERTRVTQRPKLVFCPAIVRDFKPSALVVFDTDKYELTPIYIPH